MILNIIVMAIIICVILLLMYDIYLLGKIKGIDEVIELYDEILDGYHKIYEDYHNEVLKLLDIEKEI